MKLHLKKRLKALWHIVLFLPMSPIVFVVFTCEIIGDFGAWLDRKGDWLWQGYGKLLRPIWWK